MKPSNLEDLANNLRQMLANADELLGSAAGKTRATLEDVRDHLRSAEHAMSERAHELDRAVRANPWAAIATTGIIAFVLGLLVRRR
jgi:ElaB/YqjD/DUF883 family membrane-anchored ribosome-binding protein